LTFETPPITLARLLVDAASATPEAPAIHTGEQTVSYAALYAHAVAASAVLAGDARPVVLAMPNRPEFAAWYFGAHLAGRTIAAASPHLAAPEIAFLLDDVEPGCVVVDGSLRSHYTDAAVPLVDAAWPEPAVPAADVSPAPDDIAVLQYTSGTTGGQKAAMMSHTNLVANALQNNQWFGWTAQDVILGALPLCHTWGMGCVLNAAVAAGASIALADAGDAAATLDVIEGRGVTVIYGSATMFDRLLDAAGGGAPRIFRSVRYVKAGAMLIGGTLPDRWAAAVPDVPMVLGYGLTEASPEVCNNPLDHPRRGTVGVALPGTEIRIADRDVPERVLEVGAGGEIQVRGPQVTRGYWRRPEAAALLPSGWLRTGDLGRLDEEGYLTVLDRLKDLIKFRGWSVVPAEVEHALLSHPAVAEAIVVGAPHAVDGEVPVAFVVARGASPDEAELDRHVTERIARTKRPRRYVFVDSIPKNAVGKPLRRVLRHRLG
jgi:long-chain acyl-CoA synthetase